MALEALLVAKNAKPTHEASVLSLSYAAQIIATLSALYEKADALLKAHTIRPATRRVVSVLKSQVHLELDTWKLLKSTWTVPHVRASDSISLRLQLSPSHALKLSAVSGISKAQHALAWLETSANTMLEEAGGPQLNPLDDPAYRWQYTAEKNGGVPISIDQPLREEHDPLDEVERKAESRIARETFRLLRAGRLAEAENVCRKAGQPWRAAMLGGGKRASALSANGESGAARRVLRKAASAIASCEKAVVPRHERAVCALLAGSLPPLLTVCQTYEDQLWARLSVLLDSAAEMMLDNSLSNDDIDDGVILHTFRESKFASEGMVGVPPDVLQSVRRVQAYLTLGPSISVEHLGELMSTLQGMAEQGVSQKSEWACRLAAQLCMFLKLSLVKDSILSNDGYLECFDNIIQTFVEHIVKRDIEFVDDAFRRPSMEDRKLMCMTSANFLSELHELDRSVTGLSAMLQIALRSDLRQELVEARRAKVPALKIEERRGMCLETIGTCFEVEAFEKISLTAVDGVWGQHFDMFPAEESVGSMSNEGTVDQDEPSKDDMVIRAIEFLIYPLCPNYIEALAHSNRAARRFFLLGKRDTARRVISWFPKQILGSVPLEFAKGYVKEFQYWENYFRAISDYNEWHVFKSSKKPIPIPDSVRRAAMAQPVQKDARNQLQAYNAFLRVYERECEELMTSAVHGLYECLFGEQTWWMMDVELDEKLQDDGFFKSETVQERVDEIKAVRKYAIPQMITLLHSVYHKSGKYGKAVELANEVARSDRSLFANFSSVQLRAFLKQIGESAVRLANHDVAFNDTPRPYEGTFFEEVRCQGGGAHRVSFAPSERR